MDFDEAESEAPVQELQLTPKHLSGEPIELRVGSGHPQLLPVWARPVDNASSNNVACARIKIGGLLSATQDRSVVIDLPVGQLGYERGL